MRYYSFLQFLWFAVACPFASSMWSEQDDLLFELRHHREERSAALADSARSLDGTECTDLCQSNNSRIFYLILVHNERTANDALSLLRAITGSVVLIHVDRKAEHLVPSLQTACHCAKTLLVESVYEAAWGTWSMNWPTLYALQLAVEQHWGQWDVFINLSADNWPVYTADTLDNLLAALPFNFVTSRSCETALLPTSVYAFPSWWHKRRHYTDNEQEGDVILQHLNTSSSSNEKTSQVTSTLRIHFGSQWVILQADFCKWLVQQLQNPESLPSKFRDYLIGKDRLMTDETFLPTLLMHAYPFNETSLPPINSEGELLFPNGTSTGISDVRFERMDEHVPTPFGFFWTKQRYQVPSDSNVDPPRVWGPYFLGVYDLADIRASGALFVRKVSTEVDPNILEVLPVQHAAEIPNIRWPRHVNISQKPDWKRFFSSGDQDDEEL